ncbi:MAG TPA: ankyrin repeat domain-containing protein, partial [Pirellulaceae bacterium]|nr:ankyrin repeat domain-containing protein [Pirellulaceae bacterium]
IFPELKAGGPESAAAVPLPQDLPAAEEPGDEDEFDEDDPNDEEQDDDDLGDATFAVEAPVLKEKRVKVGEKVCAIGIYSQPRGGLTPGGMGLDKFIKLVRGNIDIVEKKARGAVFGNLIGGIVVLILVNAATYGVLMANRHHPAAVSERQRDAVQAISKDDAARLDKLLARGMDVNALESGRTLLHNTDDAACARVLLARGANLEARSDEGLTPLMEAARRGHLAVAQVLLEAKVDVNAINKEHPMTALDYAVRAGQADVEALLRQAGGKPAPMAEQP